MPTELLFRLDRAYKRYGAGSLPVQVLTDALKAAALQEISNAD
jgi:hypothetical protein